MIEDASIGSTHPTPPNHGHFQQNPHHLDSRIALAFSLLPIFSFFTQPLTSTTPPKPLLLGGEKLHHPQPGLSNPICTNRLIQPHPLHTVSKGGKKYLSAFGTVGCHRQREGNSVEANKRTKGSGFCPLAFSLGRGGKTSGRWCGLSGRN